MLATGDRFQVIVRVVVLPFQYADFGFCIRCTGNDVHSHERVTFCQPVSDSHREGKVIAVGRDCLVMFGDKVLAEQALIQIPAFWLD